MFGRRFFGQRYFPHKYWRKEVTFLGVTSTNTIQKPVDYVLAGDQKDYGKFNARGRALRHIFKE